jgi:pre-mRNA-splicing factor 38A
MSIPVDPRKKNSLAVNQQQAFDQLVRHRIYESAYWKEQLFGITTDAIVDKAMELKYVGGTYGPSQKPTRFICLLLKLLQIQPEREIILAFMKNPKYKYITILGLFYWRLVASPKEIYTELENFYGDYRRLRIRDKNGSIIVGHVDAIADSLLSNEFEFDLILPRIPKRITLEEEDGLAIRISPLEKELNEYVDLNDIENRVKMAEPSKEDPESKMQVEAESDHESLKEVENKGESRIKKLIRKQKKEKKKKEGEAPGQSDSNTDEYWLSMRKKAGLE